jgi:hypothetical protein
MSIDAVALLHLSTDQLARVLRIEDEGDEGILFRAMGRTLAARSLEDATCLGLSFRFDTPEATLGSVLRRDLGELIEAHGDERGVFVYPSVAQLEATTYDAALEELGEGGMWITIPPASEARVGPRDALGVFQGLAGGLGPDLLGQMREMMEGDEGAMMQGAMMQGAMEGGLADFAKGILENEEMRGMLEGMASQLFGGGEVDGDILGKAREMAEKATAADPELAKRAEALAKSQAEIDPEMLAQLAGRLGLSIDDDGEDPEEDDDEDAEG